MQSIADTLREALARGAAQRGSATDMGKYIEDMKLDFTSEAARRILSAAIDGSNVDCVRMMTEQMSNIDIQFTIPLAARKGNLDVFKHLTSLCDKFDPQAFGSALSEAAIGNDGINPCLQFLCENYPNISNHYFADALYKTLEYANIDGLRYLFPKISNHLLSPERLDNYLRVTVSGQEFALADGSSTLKREQCIEFMADAGADWKRVVAEYNEENASMWANFLFDTMTRVVSQRQAAELSQKQGVSCPKRTHSGGL